MDIERKARIELGDNSIKVLNDKIDDNKLDYEENRDIIDIVPTGLLGEIWSLPTVAITKLIFNKRGPETFLWRYNGKLEKGYLWIDKKEIVRGKEYHTGFYKQIWPRELFH